MASQPVVPSVYQIEISGWNVEGEFFVERTELRWSERGDKRVSLRQSVRDGAVVFVRLMLQKSDHSTFPIAYQAELVADQRSRGSIEMRLLPCQPRSNESSHDSANEDRMHPVAVNEKHG